MKQENNDIETVWIFNGDSNKFCSGVFSSYEQALSWIKKNKLSGMLTCYPLNVSVYDWSIDKGYFKPKNEKHSSSIFISNFSSASQEHFRFDDGEINDI